MTPPLNVHGLLPRSRANGPGVRFVVWLQGCTRGCPGCFNPDTHAHTSRELLSTEDLCARIRAEEGIEGVTISGGEPFEQPEALLALLEGIRRTSKLSVLVFSGHVLAEIRAMELGTAILQCVDVLIDGPYNRAQHLGRGLRGSSNQRIHFLTDRYTQTDIARVPAAEIVLSPDGTVHISGVAPPRSIQTASGSD